MIGVIWTAIKASRFIRNPLMRKLGAALVAVAGVLTFGALKRREGAQAARADAKDKDYEHAQDIRDRVVDDRAQRVRELDGRGYRD